MGDLETNIDNEFEAH